MNTNTNRNYIIGAIVVVVLIIIGIIAYAASRPDTEDTDTLNGVENVQPSVLEETNGTGATGEDTNTSNPSTPINSGGNSGVTPGSKPTPSGNTSGSSASSQGVNATNQAPVGPKGDTSGAYIMLSSYFVAPNQSFYVQGYRFGANESVRVTAGGATQTVKADANGRFATGTFVASYGAGNSMSITSTGLTSGITRTAQTSVKTYNPWITLSSYYLRAGSTVSVNGNGFAPSEQVTVLFNGNVVGTVTASAAGTFSWSGSVPSGLTSVSAYGAQTLKVSHQPFTQAVN